MLDVVSTRDDVWGEIRLIASARSAGRRLRVRGAGGRGRRADPGGLRRRGPGHVRRPRRGVGAVGPGRRGPRGRGHRQVRRVPDGPEGAAGGARGQPGARPRARPKGIISVPNCTTLSLIVAARRPAPGVRPARADRRPPTRRRPGPARPASTRSTTSWTRSRATGRSASGPVTCAAWSATSGRSRPRWRSTWCPGPARSRTRAGPRRS